ncbi:ATP-binding protein [Anabaena sp. CA = ATCC 33047]|uniref:ATP-binding protein n=1 Tax=Anabaena sp. (strain CA / ATCC 33047) TaxID=52271 RepID=UPI00082BC1AA|nr:cyanophycin synthetase [Anabaena sp. CA = ATCC 33047]
MVQEKSTDLVRINARKTDVFDIFNFRHYVGPNPDLDVAALVFDFALVGDKEPLPIEDYITRVGDRYPHLKQQTYESYAQLFAQTVSAVAQLGMDLHLNRWSVKPYPNYARIAVQTLHARTTKAVIYFVWDWFEAINQDQDFGFEDQFLSLQNQFRQSVYGGPTVYALLRTAQEKGIPFFYLWEEGLIQYGWGTKQVRGVATTFDCDSHLDSELTTRKDDCKLFLKSLGFPVPKGRIVFSCKEARQVAREIGYPVAIKPVVGHKGIGVTPGVKNVDELESAYDRALAAIPQDQSTRIIVEKNISGKDFRLLCVNGKFVAATERQPASVVGDGDSTIAELIRQENRKIARLDTPTSPMSKIQIDEELELYLEEQRLSLKTVLDKGEVVYLRKVANLSAGGVSINATHTMHDDNIMLAQDIAQHFRLTCLGIDVIAESLSESWKQGNFSILEINAAPGILMHLNPAEGDSVDVPAYILETFFASGIDARIPIITFNKISGEELQATIEHILSEHPEWTIGGVCRDGVFMQRSPKVLHREYNSNMQMLLRHPKLDLLIAEYPADILEKEGMFYHGSNLVVLDNPNETEMMLMRDMVDGSTVIIKKENDVSMRRKGIIEDFTLGAEESFKQVYLKEISTIL